MREAVHRDPVWRDRSNFILTASIDPGDTDVYTEQLWARQIGASHFEICCIPFFLYDLALGDVVEADEKNFVKSIVRRSGRYVFRVHVVNLPRAGEEIIPQIEALGGLVERSSRSMFAIDAENDQNAQRIAEFLWDQEQRGTLEYETGRT